MRHADTGNNASCANRTGADTDLNGVGTRINERLRAIFGGDIAGHYLNGIGQGFNPRHGFPDTGRMTMRRIDNNQIDTGLNQRLGAGKPVIANRGGGGDAQTTLLIFRGIGVQLRFFHIFNGNQPDAMIGIIDNQQLFNAVLVQKPLGFLMGHGFLHRDEVFMGHQFRHFLRRIGGKAHIAIGQNTDQLAVLLGHRHA